MKSSEAELKRKEQYYKDHKEEILAKKHARQAQIYENKMNRNLTSEKEFEKEFARKLTKLSTIRPDACELCNTAAAKLDHLLEFHHFDYQEADKGSWLCKPCHAEADKARRRS